MPSVASGSMTAGLVFDEAARRPAEDRLAGTISELLCALPLARLVVRDGELRLGRPQSLQVRQDHQERNLIMDRGLILAFIFAGTVVGFVAIILTIVDFRRGGSMSGRSIGTFIASGVLMLVGIVIALT
jgi:hypothetical protein